MLPKEQTAFDPTKKEDKYYLSAFFNEALQNTASIVKHVGQRMNAKYPGNKFPKDDNIDEGKLHDIKMLKIEANRDFKAKLRQAAEIRAMLNRYFVLLETFKQKEDKVTRQFYFLRCVFKLAASYRNYYSHVHHNCITLKESLEKVFKDNKKKDDFKLEDFKRCFEKCFKEALKDAKRRFNFPRDTESLFITGEGKDKKIAKRYALFTKDGEKLSENGIHFLLCLLLPKERANLYLSHISGFKGTYYDKFLATRQIFTIFCLKLPKVQLISGENEQALTLDLMNYLAKCPQSLYKVLNETYQQRFITREEDDELAPTTRMVRNLHNLDRTYYFLARFIGSHHDFKAYFCVQLGKWRIAEYKNGNIERNIDQNVHKFGSLGKIRKQDNLEKANENNELKTRLSKMVQPKPSDKEWIQYAPHYAKHPHAFSISLIEKKGNKEKETDPKIIIGKNKIKKTYPADLIKQQATDFILPHRALPLIAMLLLLNEKTEKAEYQIDKLLEAYRQSAEVFLEEIEKEAAKNHLTLEDIKNKTKKYHLKVNWLPRKLIKALTGSPKPFLAQVLQKLQDEIRRTQEYRDFLCYMKKLRNSKEESDGRIEYKQKLEPFNRKYTYKPGNIASDFLKDFWRFTQRCNGKMPNASEYQILQKELALYPLHRNELDRHFKSLGFDHRNPFYKSLLEKQDREAQFFSATSKTKKGYDNTFCFPTVQDAYQSYLKEKLAQLKHIQNVLKSKPEKWKDYYEEYLFALKLPVTTQPDGKLIFKDLKKEEELKKYISNLKKALQPNGSEKDSSKKTTGLATPYGFWADRFVKFCQAYKPEVIKGLKTLNPVKLIEKCLEIEDEGTQAFYDFDRKYIFKKKEGREMCIKGMSDEVHRQVQEQIKKAGGMQKKELKKILENEAAIRLSQSYDNVLWLCAKWQLKKHFDININESKPVDSKNESKLSVPKLKDYAGGYNDTNSNNPLEQNYDFILPYFKNRYTFNIQIKDTKLRDIGKVHALLRDKRLHTMFELLAYRAGHENDSKPCLTLYYTEMKKELEYYEKYRLESLQLIQKFEQSILYRQRDNEDKKEGFVAFHKILKKKYPDEKSKDYILCLALRNSCMHNEYPWQWEELIEEKKKEKKLLFDIDPGLKSAYLKHGKGILVEN